MAKFRLFLFTFCLLSLFSVAQPLAPLTHLIRHGLILSHAPGIYKNSLNWSIQSVSNVSCNVQFSNGQKYTIKQGAAPIPIKETTTLKIKISGNDSLFTGTYVIDAEIKLPIVSIQLDYDKFLGSDGILNGHMADSNHFVGNVWQKRSLPIFFEYFDADESYGASCKIKPFGGFTLGLKEKSLHLYTDEKLGPKRLAIQPFENRTHAAFKNLVLRTSGSDQNFTRLKDVAMASLARDMGIGFQDYRQCVLLVNNQYFGIYNLREKLNKDYLKYNYNANKDSTILLELHGTYDKSYSNFFNYVGQNFPEKTAFDSLNSKMDVEQYLNWIILQTHIQNIDSRGNIRFWKAKNLDDRWRWIFFDSDLGCSVHSVGMNYLEQRLSASQTEWYNPTWATHLLRNIVKYKPLKEFFINQYCLMLSTHLKLDTIHNRISYFAGNIESEIPRHVKRRNTIHGENAKSWLKNVETLKQFFSLRDKNAYEHIMSAFGLKRNAVLLEANTSVKGLKGIHLKYSAENYEFFKAQFFPEVPVTLCASNTNHLYAFDHWANNKSRYPEIKIYPGTTEKVVAVYKHRAYSKQVANVFIAQITVDASKKETWLGFSLFNAGSDTLKNLDILLWQQDIRDSVRIRISALPSGEFLYFSNKPNKFSSLLNGKNVTDIYLWAAIDFNNLQLVLTDASKLIIDSAFVAISDTILSKNKSVTLYRDVNANSWVKNKVPIYKVKTDNMNVSDNFSMFWLIVFIIFIAALLVLLKLKNRKLALVNKAGLFVLIMFLMFNSQSIGQTADRFGLDSLHKKLINNKGKGYDSLRDLRNMRVILKNLIYRGGNNNPASVQNPLTQQALSDLNKSGFNRVIYLYNKNFEKYYSPETLDSIATNGLKYECKPRLDSININYILDLVDSRARNKSDSLIYLHCWNGWHQSGWIAAIILMQYCGFSNQQAVQYWAMNTDQNYIGYDHVKKALMGYKLNSKYSFTPEQRQTYCPCMDQAKLDSLYPVEDVLANKRSKKIKEKSEVKDRKPSDLMENYPDKNVSQPKDNPTSKSKYHTVAKGDTLSHIAHKYKTSVKKLCALNNIKPDHKLKIGQQLKVKN